MNDVLRYSLSKYLDYPTLFNFGKTCKRYYKILNPIIKRKRQEIIKNISSLFPRNIIKMIGKNNFLRKANPIEWNYDFFQGHFIIKSKKFDYPQFLYGSDPYGRSFIFARVKNHFLSIFQKYSDSIDIFVVIDPSGDSDFILKGREKINKVFEKELKTLFNS